MSLIALLVSLVSQLDDRRSESLFYDETEVYIWMRFYENDEVIQGLFSA